MGAESSTYSPSGVKFPDITFNICLARARVACVRHFVHAFTRANKDRNCRRAAIQIHVVYLGKDRKWRQVLPSCNTFALVRLRNSPPFHQRPWNPAFTIIENIFPRIVHTRARASCHSHRRHRELGAASMKQLMKHRATG